MIFANFGLEIGLLVEKLKNYSYFGPAYLILIFNTECRVIACYKEKLVTKFFFFWHLFIVWEIILPKGIDFSKCPNILLFLAVKI